MKIVPKGPTDTKSSLIEVSCYLEPLLLTWINFNPSMDK